MSTKECPANLVGRFILLVSVLGVMLLYSFGSSARSDDNQFNDNAITLPHDSYSIILMLGSTAIVVTCIPMLIDIIFDFCNYELFPGWEYRVVCILVAVLPYLSIIHHLMTSSTVDNMNAIVYNNSVLSYKCIYMIVTSIFLSLQIRLFPTKHKSIVLLICQVFIIASQLLHTTTLPSYTQYHTTYYTTNYIYKILSTLLTYTPILISVYYIPTIIVTACVRWSRLTEIEFIYTLYLLFTFLYLISIHTTGYIYDDNSHNRTNEKFIFLVRIYTIIYYTILNTIPIRILHTTNNNNIEKLKSKTNFIRYISHEIRSSLNIVFAGIEMTLKECIQLASNTNTSSNNNTLNSITAATTTPNTFAPTTPTTPITTTASSTDNSDDNSDNTDTPTTTPAIGAPPQHHTASSSIIDHIQEVYESTHTAILLLNDFLHYENIEADTFQLELSLRQVPRLLGG